MSHYFTSTPLTEGETSELRVELAGEPLVLRSAHGVFSQHGLDKATALLLDRTDLMMDLPPKSPRQPRHQLPEQSLQSELAMTTLPT